ncbi:MAG: DUF169 domain-containing protein [Clostridia bacterium]|nr:DUF169 domain-containing protein [Clostridia bacterium]
MDNAQLAEAIERYVRPDTFPVAARIWPQDAPLPEKARRPKEDLGARITICQGVSIARRYGWTLAIDTADLSCPIAQVAFGFKPALDFYTQGGLAHGMYTETAEAGARTEAAVPKLPPEERGVVVVGPLARAAFTPDAVVVYGNSAQVMVLVAAALWKRGGELVSRFSARADCADLLIRAVREREPQVILPCYGDRVFGQTQDHEMAFSFPFDRAEEIVAGLQGTHKGGVRYPIPHFLRYEAHFPETYQKLSRMWDEG